MWMLMCVIMLKLSAPGRGYCITTGCDCLFERVAVHMRTPRQGWSGWRSEIHTKGSWSAKVATPAPLCWPRVIRNVTILMASSKIYTRNVIISFSRIAFFSERRLVQTIKSIRESTDCNIRWVIRSTSEWCVSQVYMFWGIVGNFWHNHKHNHIYLNISTGSSKSALDSELHEYLHSMCMRMLISISWDRKMHVAGVLTKTSQWVT